jgi:hypothetical protein
MEKNLNVEMRTPNGFNIIKGETTSKLTSYSDLKNAVNEIAKKSVENSLKMCFFWTGGVKNVFEKLQKKKSQYLLKRKEKQLVNGRKN